MLTAATQTRLSVLGLSLGVAIACDRKSGFECKATFDAGAPQTYVYEQIRAGEDAKNTCLAEASAARPPAATQISCACHSR